MGKVRRSQLHIPQAEKERAGSLSQDVIRSDVSKLPSHILDISQQRVALLPFAHKDGVAGYLQA